MLSIFITLVSLILFSYLLPQTVYADALCGSGYVCQGGKQGGAAAFYNDCVKMGTAPNTYCSGNGFVSSVYCLENACLNSSDCTCDLNHEKIELSRTAVNNGTPRCVTENTTTPSSSCYCDNAPEGSNVCDPTLNNADCLARYPTSIYGGTATCQCETLPDVNCYADDFIVWPIGCCYADGSTPTPTSTPTTTLPPTARNLTVSGNLYLSSNPSLVGGQCTATGPSSFTSPVNLTLNHLGNIYSTSTISGAYSFLVTSVTAGQTFSISAQTTDVNYECSCPNDGAVTCSYLDLTVPAIGTDTVTRHIYFDNIEQPDSWFQSFGAGVFSQGQFTSLVPTGTCFTPICQAAVFAPQSSNASVLSSGFPLTANADGSSILTGDINDPFANIHLAGQRSSSFNQDSFATGFAGQGLGYNYFYQLAVDSGKLIRSVPAAEANLATWRSNGWLAADGQTHFFAITDANVVLNETNQFNVLDDEKVVVFISRSLAVRDLGANGDKVISVARKTATNPGGFLAFIVARNINFQSTVGEVLTVADPSNVPEVNFANANVEGVFIADNYLQTNSNLDDGAIGGLPDRKFIGAGTFVGLTTVYLNRSADNPAISTDDGNRILNNNQALENFLYRPDLLLNWPAELRSSIINWREVAPQSF